MTDKILQLPDNRNLSYALYGREDGQPVLYFHGTPGSRLEPSLVRAFGIDLDALLVKYKIQLISIDRPGMGLSTFNPKGNFVSFANDVAHLLQFLKVARSKVLCWSGGGPFALAIAKRFPGIIQAVYIITGFTVSFSSPGVFKAMHVNKIYFGAAKKIPGVLRFLMQILSKNRSAKSLPEKISGVPGVDYTMLTDPRKMKQLFSTVFLEACRQGSKGPVYEAGLYFQDFGYSLKDIKQPVHFWWGTSDKTVVRLHPEAVEQQVPNAVMHYKKDEGHLSIYIHFLEEVLKTIA